MNTAELATELITIPSVSGNEEAMLLRLEAFCSEFGLDTERQFITENRWNLFAGWASSPKVVFCTHVDTVPPFIPPHHEGRRIYGRGACDTKGIIAAMLGAGEQLILEGETPAFLFVVGEETDSIGAKTAAESGKSAEFIIVGEPTDNQLASGHKGVMSYTLRISGRAAHSAYPERGSSAVHTLLGVLQRIISADWGQHQVLGKSTLNIGLISGGVAMNTLAPEASATVIHRLVDDAQTRQRQLHELLGTDGSVEFHSLSEPQLLHIVPGFQLKVVNYGTDIPYLKSMGECLLFGPGSIHDAHTEKEFIEINSMDEAVLHYKTLYYRLLYER